MIDSTFFPKPAVHTAIIRVLFIALFLLPLSIHSPSEAGILSTLAKASKAAKVTAAVGAGLLADSLGLIKRLPTDHSVRRLAVGTDDSGHLRIASPDGEEWVITKPDDLSTMLTKTDPTAIDSLTNKHPQSIEIYIPDTTLYQHSQLFSKLPSHVELRLITRGKKHYRVTNTSKTDPPQWNIQLREHVQLNFPHPDMLDEMLFRLDRPLNRNSIRLLRLEPDHTENIASLARTNDHVLAAVDSVNPAKLNTQLRSIRGQTAIITGRIEGNVLIADAGKAGMSRTPLKTLREAASTAEVNLIVLDTASPVQAGVKGLFGTRARFPGLEQAFLKNTIGDFLDTLTSPDTSIVLTAQREGSRYIALSSLPRKVPTQSDATLLIEVPRLTLHSVHIVARNRSESEEYDRRVFHWLPSWVLITLLANAVLGIMSWSTSWSHWWGKVWKPILRESCSNVLSWYFLRSVRVLTFLVLFLPIVGGLAFLYDIVMTVFGVFKLLLKGCIWLLKLPIRIILWATRVKPRSL